MKKVIIPIIIIVIFVIGIYELVKYIDYKGKLDSLDKYILTSNESIYKEFKYKKK